MSNPVWLMVMDVLVMCLLGAMLFFAIRLSRQLKDFRAGRRDLDRLVADLNGSVTKAEKAIQGLKENARVCGRELQTQIDSARALSDELQIVSEAGDSLASRLERSAEKGAKSSGFAIRDPEFAGGDNGLFPGDEGDEEEGKFQSRAEKELYEALRAGKRKSGAGKAP
jgi:hypothetical protein